MITFARRMSKEKNIFPRVGDAPTDAVAEPRPGSAKAWLLAARPKTLTAAATPVMIGLSMAYADLSVRGATPSFSIVVADSSFSIVGATPSFSIVVAALCMLFAFIMQIDANFINDYFDFKKGTDDAATRLGPLRACAQGWITPSAMWRAIIGVTLLGCAVGLPLIYFGGWEMIIVGLLCVVFCFLYTTWLSYRALGDVLVLIFFGVVPVCVPYYLLTTAITWQVFVASLACGVVIDGLLIVNNYRDRHTDATVGKRTLVVLIGAAATERLYLSIAILAYAVCILLSLNGYPWTAVLPLVYVILHVRTWRKMVTLNQGRALNICLGETARNIFIFGLLLSMSVIL